MSYSITVDHKNKLVCYQHSGKIIREDIGQAWDNFLDLQEFTHLKYNLLSDYRGSKFIASKHDIDLICNILFELREILHDKKQAIIHDDPTSTALSLIFSNKIYKEIGFTVKIFSTREKAINWLID